MPDPQVPANLGGDAPVKSPATQGRTDSLERRQAAYKFFRDLLLGAAQKQPRKEWDNARKSYEDNPDDPSIANLWRAKVDTQAAFLDSEPAVLRFTVPTAHTDDERAERRRKGEQAVYDYIHREMDFATVLDRFRHSADVTNVGFVALLPDIDKWLPDLIYLEPEQVRIDGNCGAIIKDAGWIAYSQLASPDELHSLYPEVPLATFQDAADTRGFEAPFDDDAPAKAARASLKGEHGAQGDLKQCRVWRFYARGSYALYDQPPDEMGKGKAGLGEAKRPDAQFDTPKGEARRYLYLVEGMDVPLLDRMGWPRSMLLDKGEWPITSLTYNQARDSLYGFPDYRHERKLLAEIERVVGDLTAKQSLEGLKVIGGTSMGNHTPEIIMKFLEGKGIQYLPNLFDSAGNPLLKVLELPGLTTEDLTYLTTLIELYDQISMQPRVARGQEDPNKKATATQIETDFATARSNRRLRRYENALALIAKKTMQMAHAMLPRLTQVSLPDVEFLAEVQYAQAEVLAQEPGAKIVRLGVEAMAGENADEWLEMPQGEDATGFITLLLRSVRISVERGSTQRMVRLQNAAAFRQVFVDVLLPALQAVPAPRALVESVKKLLGMMGLDEFESIGKELDAAVQQAEALQAAEAQAMAAQPVGGGI